MTTQELTKMGTDELWLLWETDKNQIIKDELVIRHLQLVEQVAGRIRIGLPASVQLDELVNSGIIGLISSVDNYDLSRGFKFSTFAVNRIRGSILDSLRDYDWMPRSIRTKTKSLEAALVKLEGQLRRVPSDDEVANELNLDLDSYYSLLEEVKVASIMSLDQPVSGPDGEKSSLVNLLEDADVEDPRDRVEWLEAKEETKKLIQGLSQQERLVIALYYYEELTLKEVGNVLEISESRVSQIHSKVILTLKGKLRHMFDNIQGL